MGNRLNLAPKRKGILVKGISYTSRSPNAIDPAQNQSACLLCASTGMLAAALALVVLVKILHLSSAGATLLPLEENCSPSRETCAARLPDGGILFFSLAPRPVALLKPLTLEVRIEGSNMRPIEVDFSGVNAPMAFIRAYPAVNNEGSYAAQTTLPVCANGRMMWQATVRLENGDHSLLAPFRFETGMNNG